MANQDQKLIGITPAMREGSDLIEFSKKYPTRYFDVAIAEQHALTFAAGLATKGWKPVIAIYSTFLQRAYDQLIHDICLQNLNVTFAIDRAGIVGPDGPTHAGLFDLSFLRCIPNIIIMAPSNGLECWKMLTTSFNHFGPAAIRYPRGETSDPITDEIELETLPIGKSLMIRKGQGIGILAFGTMVEPAKIVADELNCTLVDMRFIKPLDTDVIINLSKDHNILVTIEENTVQGGAGSAVNEFIHKQKINVKILNIGLPDDFPSHGERNEVLSDLGLDAEGIREKISKLI